MHRFSTYTYDKSKKDLTLRHFFISHEHLSNHITDCHTKQNHPNMLIKGKEQLPVSQIADEVNSTLRKHNTLVVTAQPGAGKSTLLPLTILSGYCHAYCNKTEATDNTVQGKILVLEPRRLAARQIAYRMASMIGEQVGNTVGYRVRHDTRVGKDTQIEVLTEGILTRMLVEDQMLEGVSVVIFDEFHERNINSDLALALTREVQQLIRPDLRIVIMSATLDTDAICRHLDAPLIESEGRMYPVDIIHEGNLAISDVRDTASLMARAILKAHREHEGDILAFLPGEADIRRCHEILSSVPPPTTIYPLYAMLPQEEQRLAIAPSKTGERRIVLATSIAETSITIEGVRVVVDSGLCRRPVFDPRTGLSHLETVRISMDMARQRSGRAGRVAAGHCYRLWTLATEHRMDDCRTPEILTSDLSPMVLDVAAWGECDTGALPWLTPPPEYGVACGKALLQLLGAIDKDARITSHGRKLWQHPYHPRIAQMVVHARGREEQNLATELADILESPPTSRPNSLLHPGAGRLIAYAYPERIAHALPEGIGQYRTANGENASVDADSPLCASEWIAIASMNAGGNGRVYLAAPLSTDDLQPHIQERDNISWDNRSGCIIANRERRVGMLLCSSHPIPSPDRAVIDRVISEAACKSGTSMLDFASEDVQQMQRRIAVLASWHPELELPDLSTEVVLGLATEWLPMYLGKATTTAELKRIDLHAALWAMLTYDQQQQAQRLAPTHLQLPSGKRVRVEYRQGAELPIVRVKLQECFGLAETPRIDGGKRPVLMELLSPGFKPVQLTQDLRSFWQTTYFEVRKELRRRYPKHAWPEKPEI